MIKISREVINTDKIISRMGSWKDNKLQMQAGKKAVTLINKYFEEGIRALEIN